MSLPPLPPFFSPGRDLLASNPPTELTENYYECRTSWQTALFNAVGVSLANVSLAVSVAGLLLVPFVFLLLEVTLPVYVFRAEQFLLH
jgi:hypothetical protein